MDGYLLVNAELDSMEGVIDSGGGIGLKTSPRRTAIEKAQAELRQEYDVREERRRELEFLEKGGNPLDFKFGIATSHSVQSTSLTDHQAEHFLNSGLKDSFALASSPHGDSVESSGRPAVPTVSEPNTADNLLLFDSGNKSVEGENNVRYPNRQHRTSESERSYKANTNQNIKETEDSAIFRPYARRNRTKINRDSARSSSTDLVQNRGGLATSISVRRGSVDGKGCNSEAANQKDRQTTSVSCPVFANSNRTVVPKNVAPSNTLHTKVDGGPAVRESAAGSKTSLLKDEADITIRKNSAGLHLEETGEKAQLVLTSTEIGSPKAATIAGQENNSTQMDELGDSTGEKKSLTDRAAAGTESSHANNLEVDVDTERDLYRADKLDSDEISMPKVSRVEGLLNQTVGELKIEDETGRSTTIISECSPAREMQMNSVKIENENYRSVAELQNEEECSDTDKKLQHGLVVPENDKKVSSVLADDPSRFVHPGKPQASVDASSCMVGDNVLSGTDVEALKHQPSSDDGSKALDTVKEDSFLEEARIIQAKRKRIAELSCGTAPVEVREKCQWDFVLEEMAWLANDFAQGSAYDQTWHPDSSVHAEQKDHWKKRVENHFDTNGIYGPHAKKQKTTKQLVENNFDGAIALTGSIPSPAASQMSNMSNPNKSIKFIGGRDRARKIKGLKGSARQLFQRLQGPMEEDTLKSHFEKICLIGKKLHYRKTQALILFYCCCFCLSATVSSIFKNDGRDPKQIVPVHNSQVMALSQVFPNNLNGGVLTPLDLCDASTSGQDLFSLENPGSHLGLPMLNQGTPVLPTSGPNPSTPGSSGVVPGNSLPTTLGLHHSSARDGRFNVSRGPLPLDEQHRLQQSNQMSPGRNLQQPSSSTPGAVSGSGHRMVPGANTMGGSGMNRGAPMSRPGFQAIGSAAMPNTGSMLSSGMVGIPKTGNIHSGGASQGNPMSRPPREAVQHMMRAAQGNSQGIPAFGSLSSGFTNNQTTPVQAYPGHLSQQHQMPHQSHVLGNSQHPHLQSPSPSHATRAQHDGFALRQRLMHQRFVQQQQFASSGTKMPHGQQQQQPQGTSVSSSTQNNQQTQPPVSPQRLPPPVSTSPNTNALTQKNPQKSQLPLHGLARNPQSGAPGVNNQSGKQRQRQLQQQSGRQHPHQRQPSQGQQQNKQSKGAGRGNMIHQNITLDQSHVNGLTMSPGNQATEKGDAMVAVRPDRESNVGTATSTHLQSKPFVSPQSLNHSQQLPKSFSGATSSSQEHQIQLPSDNSIQGQSSPAASCNILSTSSPSVAPAVGPSNHQHLLLHQKQRNQVQAQRIAHQNHIENSDLSTKSQAERVPRVPQPVPDTTQTASMSTSKGMPQVTNDSNNIKAVGSTAVPSPNGLEPPASAASVQSAAPNVVNSSNTDSTGSDPVTALKQGLAPKHFPGGLPCQELKGLIQRQESLPTVEMRPKLPEQLTVQNQKRLASDQQSPQIEEAQELSSPKPPDTKVE
ncbi:hypothetical protein F2Q68_00034631 [Brassica cretica]|uniref:HSA domain-containing protein n=1 Tax=Brassica cretica TaxID=69181 RepID=A0A8S9GY39_BRACR|nr:hypothetical protein F2Q68_00034631 [Brassica cretica]